MFAGLGFKFVKPEDVSSIFAFGRKFEDQNFSRVRSSGQPLLIDVSGKDKNSIAISKRELERNGYQTYMIFVHSSLAISNKRHILRSNDSTMSGLSRINWEASQRDLPYYTKLFGPNFILINNNEELVGQNGHILSLKWKNLAFKSIGSSKGVLPSRLSV